MCCNGALFTDVTLEPEDQGRVRLEVLRGSSRMSQPCLHLVEATCSIYSERPRACQTFRCALLRRVEAKEVELPDALHAVRRALALKRELEALLPEESGPLTLRLSRTSKRLRPGEAAPWLLAAAELRIYLMRDFHDPIRPAGEDDPDAEATSTSD